MSAFWKFFGIFLIIWVIWYYTGGPQRSTGIKPYVYYDRDTMEVRKSNTELEDGLKEMIINPNQIESGLQQIEHNLNNPSFTQPAY